MTNRILSKCRNNGRVASVDDGEIMKIFIATDLHGSEFWAESVVQRFKQTNSDILVLLGDIYNHGPRNPFPKQYAPMRVAEILGEVADRLIVIKGNCDSEVDQMISNFTFLQHNVLYCGHRKMFFTHGHVYNKDNLPCLGKGDVLFYGHFHKNEIVEKDGVTCVNISSCALPKDVAAYCIAQENSVCIFDFDGKEILSKNF